MVDQINADIDRISLGDIEAGRVPAELMPLVQERVKAQLVVMTEGLQQLSRQMAYVLDGFAVAYQEQTSRGRTLGRSFMEMDIFQISAWLDENQVTPLLLLGLVSEVSEMESEELKALKNATEVKLEEIKRQKDERWSKPVAAMAVANRLYSADEKKEWEIIAKQGFNEKRTEFSIKTTGRINKSKLAKFVANKCKAKARTVSDYFSKTNFYRTLES